MKYLRAYSCLTRFDQNKITSSKTHAKMVLVNFINKVWVSTQFLLTFTFEIIDRKIGCLLQKHCRLLIHSLPLSLSLSLLLSLSFCVSFPLSHSFSLSLYLPPSLSFYLSSSPILSSSFSLSPSHSLSVSFSLSPPLSLSHSLNGLSLHLCLINVLIEEVRPRPN